ncbi:molybdopterin molybdotransferase MoeA [Liquorilactobacillus satsumensis]|uniref:molybdopterin molybdotransferase MoeA n=1 Tax=Liquorilactobacillus satsumensis TaxID=259059 RepID=UPI0039ECC91D
MLTRRYPVSITEAQKLLTKVKLEPQIEMLSTSEANHHVLAADIEAPLDYPHFRRSGYDGYAIRAEDDDDFPKSFNVVGNIPAGAVFDHPLGKNEAVRIMTGASVPVNAGKVIMLEQTRAIPDHPDQIKILVTQKHSNITEIGTEFKVHDLLISKNTELNPGGLAILSAFGIQKIPVYRRPKIAIITTGTELLQSSDSLVLGKIYNSNLVLLKNLIQENGGLLTQAKQLIDDKQLFQEALHQAIATNDIVITDGGVSVGDFDFVADTARNADNLLFNKLRMRPGSVTTAFIQDQTLILALSGNPGACFTAFYLYVEPILRRFLCQKSKVCKIKATLASPYHKINGFDRILRGVYQKTTTGYLVFPNGSDRSGDLSNLQTTTCLIKIPHSNRPIDLNTEVTAWLLPFR